MADKLHVFEQKVDQLLKLVERLRAENQKTQSENSALKVDLGHIQTELNRLRLQQNDQSQAVRDRLQVLLAHVRELEQIGG